MEDLCFMEIVKKYSSQDTSVFVFLFQTIIVHAVE